MREIKFKYIYGTSEKEYLFSRVFTLEDIANQLHLDEICDCALLREHEILAKLQYTGSKDEDGVEIYEGDIVAFEHPFYGKVNALVTYHTYQYILDFLVGQSEQSENLSNYNLCEVIGSIYRNKELLDENDFK